MRIGGSFSFFRGRKKTVFMGVYKGFLFSRSFICFVAWKRMTCRNGGNFSRASSKENHLILNASFEAVYFRIPLGVSIREGSLHSSWVRGVSTGLYSAI